MNTFECSERKSFLVPTIRKRTVVKQPPRAIHFRNSLNSINLIRNEIFVIANSYPRASEGKNKLRPLSTVQAHRKTASFKSPSLFSSICSGKRESLSAYRKNKLDSEEEIETFKADCISYFIDR